MRRITQLRLGKSKWFSLFFSRTCLRDPGHPDVSKSIQSTSLSIVRPCFTIKTLKYPRHLNKSSFTQAWTLTGSKSHRWTERSWAWFALCFASVRTLMLLLWQQTISLLSGWRHFGWCSPLFYTDTQTHPNFHESILKHDHVKYLTSNSNPANQSTSLTHLYCGLPTI